MRRPKQLRHPGVGDHVLLSAAGLAVEHLGEKRAGVADDVSAGLHDQRQAALPHQRDDDGRERVEVRGLFGVVADSQASPDVEVGEVARAERSQFPTECEEPLRSDAIGLDPAQLRAEMHVQPDQPHVLQGERDPGDRDHVLVLNSELAPLLSGLDVLVRRLERDFGIHANRDRRDRARLPGDAIDGPQLLLRLDVEEHDAGVERLANLGVGLPDPAKDDVLRLEPGQHRAMQLAAGHDVDAGAQLANDAKDGPAGVRLERVVQSVRNAAQRLVEPPVAIANRRRAVDVHGRARRRRRSAREERPRSAARRRRAETPTSVRLCPNGFGH